MKVAVMVMALFMMALARITLRSMYAMVGVFRILFLIFLVALRSFL